MTPEYESKTDKYQPTLCLINVKIHDSEFLNHTEKDKWGGPLINLHFTNNLSPPFDLNNLRKCISTTIKL